MSVKKGVPSFLLGLPASKNTSSWPIPPLAHEPVEAPPALLAYHHCPGQQCWHEARTRVTALPIAQQPTVAPRAGLTLRHLALGRSNIGMWLSQIP